VSDFGRLVRDHSSPGVLRSHSHSHSHSHSLSHHHDLTGDPEAHRSALPRQAGLGKLLFLDTFSGIAGDMTVAALVDLGVPFEVVRDSVARLELRGVEIALSRAYAGAIGGSRFHVGISGEQRERSYAEIEALLERAPLDEPVRRLARRAFARLAEAEGEVHRISPAEVTFHEVGAADAIVDVVGAAAAFEYLGAEVVTAPLPMGRGMVACRHGPLPLPAPATVACLRGVPTYDAGIEAELVTPTGAALVASVARDFSPWPRFSPERIGWGCGTRLLPDRPNALRAVLGLPLAVEDPVATHTLLEANVDDLTGELAAHAIQAALAAGAVDAWAVPITMKKGRPALTLAALAPSAAAARIAEILLRETSSLGVRHIPLRRTERPRRLVEVDTPFGKIPVKLAEGPYGPASAKPEFDACARAAEAAGVSVREVLAAALAAVER
jgi:uncharacterized protein (TIGR00299 family) protein